jgi:hypothetical protein
LPAEIAVTPELKPLTVLGGSKLFPLAVPVCPFEVDPQHFISPVLNKMHVCEPPEEIALTTDDRPKTFTGVVLDVLVPSPNSPLPLFPQHFAPPASKVAQACKFPTLTDFTPELRPLTAVGVLRLVVVPSPIWP